MISLRISLYIWLCMEMKVSGSVVQWGRISFRAVSPFRIKLFETKSSFGDVPQN
jgi:hypothetical protein